MSKEAMECAKGIGKLNPSGIEGRNLFDIESWHFDKAVKIIEKHMARRETRLVKALDKSWQELACIETENRTITEQRVVEIVQQALTTHKEER